VDNEQWKGKYSNPLGLARLVDAYENRQLPKGKIVRSNWESVLNSAQQECLFLPLRSVWALITETYQMPPTMHILVMSSTKN
jgi:hypothetical protein